MLGKFQAFNLQNGRNMKQRDRLKPLNLLNCSLVHRQEKNQGDSNEIRNIVV